MTKPEMLQALDEGKRVRHMYFTEEEWMEKQGDYFVFEDGICCLPNEFWRWRADEYWYHDWELVKNLP